MEWCTVWGRRQWSYIRWISRHTTKFKRMAWWRSCERWLQRNSFSHHPNIVLFCGSESVSCCFKTDTVTGEPIGRTPQCLTPWKPACHFSLPSHFLRQTFETRRSHSSRSLHADRRIDRWVNGVYNLPSEQFSDVLGFKTNRLFIAREGLHFWFLTSLTGR